MGCRVLMPFLLSVPQKSFYQDFVVGISEALRELGHEPSHFPFDDVEGLSENERASLMRQLDRDKPGAVLDVACYGYATSQASLRTSGPPRMFDVYDIPYAGMLLDHPFNQAVAGIAAPRRYGVYPDLGHPPQMRMLYPGLRFAGEIVAPPAVRPASGRSSTERPIDVLYVGNLESHVTKRFWRDPSVQHATPTMDPGFCDALTDIATAEPERSLHLCLQTVQRQYSVPPGFDLLLNVRRTEAHLRYLFRLSAVLALAKSGLPLRVVGKGWGNVDLPTNVTVQAPTDYQGFLQLAGMSKICVDASTYVDGVNDRVFSYAVNGAVCFTNAAGYLRPIVGDDVGIRFYSMLRLQGMVANVRELLDRPAELAEMGARARALVLSAHTWRHRLEHILRAILP